MNIVRLPGLCIAAMTLAFAFLPASAGSENKKSVFACEGPARAGVIACCESAVKIKTPLWMTTTHATCRTSVVCAPARRSDSPRISKVRGADWCHIVLRPNSAEFWGVDLAIFGDGLEGPAKSDR